MVLSIDTADSQETKVLLKDQKGKNLDSLVSQRRYGSQVLISQIEKILKRNKISFDNLTGIEINEGPGSFTGLRVGTSCANALGHFLQIPVNGQKVGQIVLPKYE